jgi:hypothetical protein
MTTDPGKLILLSASTMSSFLLYFCIGQSPLVTTQLSSSVGDLPLKPGYFGFVGSGSYFLVISVLSFT